MKDFRPFLNAELARLSRLVLAAMFISGFYMWFLFDASIDGAFASIQSIKHDWPIGTLFRSLHKVGASFLFALGYYHVGRGLLWRSYAQSDRSAWFVAVGMISILLGLCFTGQALPQGQMNYWSATVVLNLISSLPLVGPEFANFLTEDGAPNIDCLMDIHIIAACCFVFLVARHALRMNKAGLSKNRPRIHSVTLVLFAMAVTWLPRLLDVAANDFPSDPLTTPDPIVPEWFFLPFYAMLRAVTSGLVLPFTSVEILSSSALGLLVMLGPIFLLGVMPWLDPRGGREARRIRRAAFTVLVLDWLGLAVLGFLRPEPWCVSVAQILTLYYFCHFLFLLPILAWRERHGVLLKV